MVVVGWCMLSICSWHKLTPIGCNEKLFGRECLYMAHGILLHADTITLLQLCMLRMVYSSDRMLTKLHPHNPPPPHGNFNSYSWHFNATTSAYAPITPCYLPFLHPLNGIELHAPIYCAPHGASCWRLVHGVVPCHCMGIVSLLYWAGCKGAWAN